MIKEHLHGKKYVAYLDVLGFKELVNESHKDLLEDYFVTITEALEDISTDKQSVESTLISDSIILACPHSESDLAMLFRAIQTIQLRLAIKNIWIRGAVSIGEIYFAPNKIVVGKGLVDAYLLEMQAIYPRVIVDPKIILEYHTKTHFIQTFNGRNNLIPGNEEKIPLLYEHIGVDKFIEEDSVFVTFAERLIYQRQEDIHLIHLNIQGQLYRGQANYSKYLWIKKYFTEVLTREAGRTQMPSGVQLSDQGKFFRDYANIFNSL